MPRTQSNSSCTLECYKSHKPSCQPSDTNDQSQHVPKQAQSVIDDGSPFDRILEDPQIQYYLKFPSLKHHLSAIISILTDQQVSGEYTAEGRQYVALKKLRELRKGGREENELVEEFVLRVLELLES